MISWQAVFLDRDGVINENRSDHVRSWHEFRFLPGAPQAIARLNQAGMRVFVITNQAVVNRGMMTHADLQALHARMTEEINREGGQIESVVYCPHRPDEDCGCRKPRPGLILQAAQRHGIDLRQTVVIGDALADVEAGAAAGCHTFLVLTGRGQEQLALAEQSGAVGFTVASDLGAAVELLIDANEDCTPYQTSRHAEAAGPTAWADSRLPDNRGWVRS